MHKSEKKLSIAIVILNYNCEQDLIKCTSQIAAQEDIKHTIILVDNASRSESVERIKTWLLDWHPDPVIGSEASVSDWIARNRDSARSPGRVYFIMHHQNRGYSAGNNIGIRVADALESDAVLIANPDMQFENKNYLSCLSNTLFSSEKNYIAASRILGLDGNDQNPQRESSYFEELFWPYLKIKHRLFSRSLVVSHATEHPIKVIKVSGCCQLIRMRFLKDCGNLDENVFLYCEEPILSARVRKAGGQIIYDPSVVAVHAHNSKTKGNGAKSALTFINSRKYYIRKYSSYNYLQKKLLALSYLTMTLYYRIKSYL